jgi:N-acetylmuramate 1-kinase
MTSISSDRLLHQTRIRFPDFSEVGVQITPIEKGGSDRRFYRVRCGANQTIILVKYDLEREENRIYAEIAEFLNAHRVRVPKIYFHDATEGLIWLEDLGENDLWSFRKESWLVRRAFYESALDEIAKLHRLPLSAADEIRGDLAPRFNAALYQWEQHYFFENCLGRYFGLKPKEIEALGALPALQEMAKRLGRLPRVLVHRDFQSQNIIIRNGQAHLIDFQGMRPGRYEYDLASLLYDPYVTLVAEERKQLLEYYYTIRPGNRNQSAADFAEIFRLCAIQRLMQALGAYGFLGLVRGSKPFLQHIGPAISSLHLLIEETAGLDRLDQVLSDLACVSGR